MGEGSESGGERVGILEENSKQQKNPNKTLKNSTQAKHTHKGTKSTHLHKRATKSRQTGCMSHRREGDQSEGGSERRIPSFQHHGPER